MSFLVVALTWTMLLIVYSALPAIIPSHFGWAGQPDATTAKSWWSVFLPAVLQVILVGLTWWLSYHPQYSNLPTTLTLQLIPEPTQTTIKKLLAHMLVMVGLIASLIMAYISLGTVRVAFGLADGLNSWAVFGLVALLLLTIWTYTVWLIKITRQLPKPPPSQPPA